MPSSMPVAFVITVIASEFLKELRIVAYGHKMVEGVVISFQPNELLIRSLMG